MNKSFTSFPSIIVFFVCLFFNCGNSSHQNSKSFSANFTLKTIATGKGTGSVEVADFNKDGYPDIVVANSDDSTISVFLSDGKSNFNKANESTFFANKYPNDIA